MEINRTFRGYYFIEAMTSSFVYKLSKCHLKTSYKVFRNLKNVRSCRNSKEQIFGQTVTDVRKVHGL